MKASVLILPTVAALISVGCMPDYNPSNYIEKYRVIGVTAEPPAVVFTPEYQGSVTLTLVDSFPFSADPDKEYVEPEIDSIEWSVCPISAGAAAQYACVMDEIPLTDVTPDGRSAVFDGALVAFGVEMLGSQFDAIADGLRQAVKFADQCTRDVITGYDNCLLTGTTEECNGPAFEGFKACLYAGGLTPVFHVTIRVTDMLLDDDDLPVLDDDGKPVMRERVLETFKSVSFGPYGPENPPNRNPEFSIRRGTGDFTVSEDILDPDNLIVTTLGDRTQPTILACPGQSLRFGASVPAWSIDKLTGDDSVPVDEYFQISWYTNNGRFAKVRIGSVVAEGRELDLSNTLTFKEDEPVGTTTVDVVMRDEAFGLSHLKFFVKDAPRDWCRGIRRDQQSEGGAE